MLHLKVTALTRVQFIIEFSEVMDLRSTRPAGTLIKLMAGVSNTTTAHTLTPVPVVPAEGT